MKSKSGARQVTKLPVDPGPAAWNSILPEQKPARVLDAHMSADWLVVGAGFAGISAARRLTQLAPGARVVMLEASRVAHGPSGRNSGFMIDLPHDLASDDYGGDPQRDRDQIRLNRHAIEFAQEAAVQYDLGNEAFSICGKLNAAASDKGLKHNAQYATHLDALGEAHSFLDENAMRKLTGSPWFTGGLFTPGAAMIQPALYVRGVVEGFESQVNVFEQSPVIELATEGGAWRATTPGGSVSAGGVILAVNGHIQSFGFYPRQLLHVFTYASMTRNLSASEIKTLGGEPVWGATPADPMGTTVRRISGTGGDRIVIRNRFTCDPSMQVSARRIANVGLTHDRSFRNRFPMLPDVSMEFRWGGRLCLSKNNVSAFGELEPGLYSACCQNGLGAARGTLGGKLAADLALNHDSDFLQLLQNEERPATLPPAAITQLGANLKIRVDEQRAGKEL